MLALQSTFEKLVQSLLAHLEESERQPTNLPARVETCIRACEESLQQLRQWVMDHPFPDQDTEIYFFKSVKPVVVARYLFYRKQFRLCVDTCSLSKEMRQSFYQEQLKATQQFFTDHQFYYTYYLTGDFRYDEYYFLRANYDWKLCPDFHYPAEPGFSTNFDGMLAVIIANELWKEYLLRQIDGYEKDNGKAVNVSGLFWIGGPTTLVEIGYGLAGSGWCGNATIKEIMDGLSGLFNIQLKDYYKTFQQISERKINLTKAIDELKEGFLTYKKRVDEQQDT